MYDDFDLQLLKQRNAPDPEENVRRANRILELSNESRFEEAEALLPSITDPSIHEDLVHMIEFNRTCLCIRE
jgi:hypothetical protein